MNLAVAEQIVFVLLAEVAQRGRRFISGRASLASTCQARGVLAGILAITWLSPLARGANLIVNGGFENGSSPWKMQEATNTSAGAYAHSGTSYLQILPLPYAGHQGNCNQTISIPANVTAATLAYYWNVSQLNNSVVNDSLTVLVRDPVNFSVLENFAYYSSANRSAPGNPNYHLAQFSLLPYAGRSVRLDFITANDPVSGVTVFRIDDVSVLTSTSPCNCALGATNNTLSTPQSGSGSFDIFSTNSACLWVPTSSSWIHASSKGTGNGVINYTYDANTSTSPRTGAINALGHVFTITQPGLLAAPGSLTPANGAIGVSIKPALAWAPVAGATQYRLMLTTNAGKLPLEAYASTCTNCAPAGFVGSTDITNYTAPNPFPLGGGTSHVLKHGTKYYWKVQAWNDNGFAGVYSSMSSFTTAPITSPVMKTFDLAGSNFSITLATEVGVDYFLERKESLSDPVWTPVQSGSGNGNDVILYDSNATGTSKLYRVRASDSL